MRLGTCRKIQIFPYMQHWKCTIKLAVEYLSLLHSDSDVFVVSCVGVILQKTLALTSIDAMAMNKPNNLEGLDANWFQ